MTDNRYDEMKNLLEKLEEALANGRTMIHTIQPIEDWANLDLIEDRTYEDGKHDGYLIGLRDGIESAMGMVEHFIDTLERRI